MSASASPDHRTQVDTDHGLRPPPWSVGSGRVPGSGARLGHVYRVQRTLGEGGMGVVVLARDEELDRDVAIKLIHPEHAGDTRLRRRFLTEARAMARVRHPNTAQVHAFGDHEGRPYFVMEYVPGTDLSTWLSDRTERNEPVSVDEAVGIIDQVSRGLAAIHRAGATHGDIKPANVLLGPSFRAVLTDMGLARLIDAREGDSTVPAGTPSYMAPELARGQALDHDGARLADMYALGVLAYQLFAGGPPFKGKTTQSVLHAHVHEQPPSLLVARPELPLVFDHVIQRCLAKRPEDRIPDPDSLRRALAIARDQLALAVPPMRVLVADDDPEARHWSSELLRDEFPDAEIALAEDGAQALRLAVRMRPTLVLSDLHMPRMNGVELTAALRRLPELADVPIVVVTGVGGAGDWQVLRRLGADGFLVKPVDPFALLGVVRRLVGRADGRNDKKYPEHPLAR